MFKTILTSMMFGALAWGQTPDFDSPHHPSRILVRFQPGTSYQNKQSLHELLGTGPVLQEYAILSDLQLVQVPEGTVEDSVMAYLSDPCVLYAEPDYEREPASTCNPNDPKFTDPANYLEELKRIRAPEGWCVETGDPDLLVAVIDSGVKYDHPDLIDNIWVNPIECPGGYGHCVADGIDQDGNGYIDDFYGWNFKDANNEPKETLSGYHGTHVAGIIGAVGNNGVGVVGVNWHVKLVALKVGDYPYFV